MTSSQRNMQAIQRTKVAPNTMTAWWIGQAGFVFKTPQNRTLVIDAYLSDIIGRHREAGRRLYPPPIEPEDLCCDYFLCTHDHLDHLDPETIERLAHRDEMVFVGPRNCVRHYRQLGIPKRQTVLLEAGEQVELDSLVLRGTFCVPNDEAVLDSIGVLLSLPNGPMLFHTGDTGFSSFFNYLTKYPIDVLLTCINGRFGNLNIREAVKLTAMLRPSMVVPHHYDIFRFNLADPAKFKARLQAARVPVKCHIPTRMKPIICRRRCRQCNP